MSTAVLRGRSKEAIYAPMVVGGPLTSDQVPLLTKSERVAKEVFEKAPQCSSSIIPKVIYCGSDLFTVLRMTAGLQNALGAAPNPPGMSAIGLTSVFSIYTGACTAQRGYESYKQASRIDDEAGEVIAKANIARGPFEVLGGLAFTPFRALSIAAMYTSSKAVVVAQAVFGAIGSAFVVASYLFLMVPSIITLHQNRTFDAKLCGAIEKHETRYGKVKMGIKTLMEELSGTVEEKRAFLKQFAEDPKKWKGKEVKAVDPSLLTDQERGFLFEEATRLGAPDYTHVNELYGRFKAEFVKFKEKKEAKFGRKTGPETVAWVKEELAKPPKEQLLHQLEWGKGLDQAEERLGQVKKEISKNRLLHIGMIVMNVIGFITVVAGTVVGTVSTGGALGVVIAVAWMISAVAMLAIDGYFLYKAVQHGDMNKNDKIAFFVVCTLMIGIAGAGMFFSGGIAPLVIGGMIIALWVGVAGYVYYQSRQPNHDEVPHPVPNQLDAFTSYKKSSIKLH